jgi:hypothetical protein
MITVSSMVKEVFLHHGFQLNSTKIHHFVWKADEMKGPRVECYNLQVSEYQVAYDRLKKDFCLSTVE